MPDAAVFGGALDRPGSYLRELRDRRTGSYLVPEPLVSGTGAAHANGLTGAGQRMAVIDTGVWNVHPVIAAALDQQLDLTGEGADDENGHGTISALIALSGAPQARLVSVKALDRCGRGPKQLLIDGLERAAAAGATVINLSAGVFDPSCRGDCDLCSAARACNQAGALVLAAAGNRGGEVACPAKLAFAAGEPGFAVAAFDVRDGAIVPTSGRGSFAGPVGAFRLVPFRIGEESLP